MSGEGTLRVGGHPPHYMPILKGRLGELKALEATLPAHIGQFTPLVEAVVGDVETDEEGEALPQAVETSLETFAGRLALRWPHPRRLIIDAGLIPSPTYYYPMVQLIQLFAGHGRPICPTIRPSDDADALRETATAMGAHHIEELCIRLANEDLDDSDEPTDSALRRVLDTVGIDPSNVDLVLDFGALPDENNAALSGRIARLVINELPFVEGWRTVVVAGGGFPADLNMVQPGVPAEVPRYELTLYRRVAERSPQRLPDFGDYSIAHPALATGVGFAPAPQIRYTTGEFWTVLKGRRRDPRSSMQFYDICQQLRQLTEVDPELSWGDEYIVDAAQGQRSTGNAMIWRAIGTSHHIASVVSDLANRGAP